ncbi:bifunctional ADP-dependent NAD(P)H-hydrate dehydratase/NAD(P)H-hydrate epimerase [Noviherbaspirillum massiliense]|uniref:bifunctional ADP-dependent NAD(P)H-hydrate dehydratase/NAD(P)H-hydrate epimerase n=1 Tax=Noviherbaspirillum massiliense TaxID=1465823 RepID=UPI0002F09B6B|nr:bifunctional ADP-dependent NAD(P)H-hydrate dehydratase/NAD(P)H-hydrate epimerase [Noviherbaspirillum massiliense]
MINHTFLYTVAELREIERAALAGLPAGTLMQRSGQAAAEVALKLIPDPPEAAKVLVIAGPGNNGGDALETAFRLAHAGVRVLVLPCLDADKLPPDAQQALQRAKNVPLQFADPARREDILSSNYSLVIDGLFGIGLARPIEGELADLVARINQLDCPVLALDVPSGLDADTGNVIGKQGVTVRASHTITFIGDKPGLHTCDGQDYAGKVSVANLHVDERFLHTSHARLNDVALFAEFLRPRSRNSHKGTYGDVGIIGGAPGMAGAAVLAGRAAAKCGAGRVFIGFLGEPLAYDNAHPELMCRRATHIGIGTSVLITGPGLGTSNIAQALLERSLSASKLVLDADALNLLAAFPALAQKLAERTENALMTPHPLEAARLLGTTAAEIQRDRLAAARQLASRFNAVVALKGSGTVIARPDGEAVVNATGNPALATAGSGDVLSGICGALLAQHWPAWEAALGSVWLHGHAADILVEQGSGPIGLTASELIPAVRLALNQLAGNGRSPRGAH